MSQPSFPSFLYFLLHPGSRGTSCPTPTCFLKSSHLIPEGVDSWHCAELGESFS